MTRRPTDLRQALRMQRPQTYTLPAQIAGVARGARTCTAGGR